jgi:hypothetical protein
MPKCQLLGVLGGQMPKCQLLGLSVGSVALHHTRVRCTLYGVNVPILGGSGDQHRGSRGGTGAIPDTPIIIHPIMHP